MSGAAPSPPAALACDARGSPVLVTIEAGTLVVWQWTRGAWQRERTLEGWPFGHPFAAWDAARGDVVAGVVSGSLAGPHGPIEGPWGLPSPIVEVRFVALSRPTDVRVSRQELALVRRVSAATVSSGGGIYLQLAAADRSRTLHVTGSEVKTLGEPRRRPSSSVPPMTILAREAPEWLALDEKARQIIGTSHLGTFRKLGTASTWTVNGALQIETSMWKLVEGVHSARPPVGPLAFDPQRGVVVGFQAGELVGFVDGVFRTCEPRVRAPRLGGDAALFADRLRGRLVAVGPASDDLRRLETWVAAGGDFERVERPAPPPSPRRSASDEAVPGPVVASTAPVDAWAIGRGEDEVSALAIPVVVPDGAQIVASLPLEGTGVRQAKAIVLLHGPRPGELRVVLLRTPAPTALRDDTRGVLVAASTTAFEDTTARAGDKIGGVPRGDALPEPTCASCTRPMVFVVQLEKTGPGGGMMRLFAFACPGECSGAAFVRA